MEKNKKFKSILIVLIIILICIGVILGIFFYKISKNKTPEKILNLFVYALNYDDVDGMLKCIEPSEAELIENELKEINDITDSEISEKFTDYLPFLPNYLKADTFPEFDIEIISKYTDNKNLIITIDINNTGINYDVYFIKINCKWYIQYALKSYKIAESETDTITNTSAVSTTSVLVSSTVSSTVSTRKVTVTTVKEEVSDGKLVCVSDYIPDAVIDIRYATTNNFTGTVIYDDSNAYLCYGTVKKLLKVQEALKEKGFSIIIWDAYRPEEAQYKLWEVCPNPTYVANPQNGTTSHSRGNTIDLGIVYTDGSEVELPSGFDEFSLLADRDYSDVSEEAGENSRLLEEIMTTYGFKGYWGEWWHYSDENVYTIISD